MTKEKINDLDPLETREWIEAMDAVVERDGIERAQFLLSQLADQAILSGAGSPYSANTPYTNTIPPELEIHSKGNHDLEWKIRVFDEVIRLKLLYSFEHIQLTETARNRIDAFQIKHSKNNARETKFH